MAVSAGYVVDRIALLKMLNEALATEMVNDDPTTGQLLREILLVEEKHADELAGLLAGLPSPV